MSDLAAQLIEHLPALRRYARALTGDGDAADDLVQDCLERAWSRAHLFRRGENMRTWLFAILHNLHVSAVRRRRLPAVAFEATPPRADDATAQEAHAEVAELDRALAQLPPEQAAAVLLVGLEDLSYREAAAALGIPEGTLMSRLHRGRQRLRALLAGESAPRLKRVR